MSFTPSTPYLTTDGIVEIYNQQEQFLGIVLITRKNKPLGIALPGGFVDVGETVEEAVVREMKEEISLDVEITTLLGVFSDPKRDSRFHTVSVVYVCKAYGKPQGADDAKEAFIAPLRNLPLEKLVFDHATILQRYLEYKGFKPS
jgi:8-oxo-dGTP diphosphatase